MRGTNNPDYTLRPDLQLYLDNKKRNFDLDCPLSRVSKTINYYSMSINSNVNFYLDTNLLAFCIKQFYLCYK